MRLLSPHILAILAIPLAASAAPADLLDRVVAVVNDEVIFLSQITEAESDLGVSSGRPAVQRLQRHDALESLIDAVLLRQEAERRGLEPPEGLIAEAVDERMEVILEQWPDRFTFDQWLASEGMSRATLRQHLRTDEGEAWMRRTLIMSRMPSPPTEIELEAQFDLAQIVLAVPEDASEAVVESIYRDCLDLRARVLQGESFADLADRFSNDPVTGPRGGSLGLITLSSIDPGIAEAVENLQTGDLSLPVRTERAWHLFQVRRLITPRQRWQMQAFDEARADLIESLRRQAHIEIHLD